MLYFYRFFLSSTYPEVAKMKLSIVVVDGCDEDALCDLIHGKLFKKTRFLLNLHDILFCLQVGKINFLAY